MAVTTTALLSWLTENESKQNIHQARYKAAQPLLPAEEHRQHATRTDTSGNRHMSKACSLSRILPRRLILLERVTMLYLSSANSNMVEFQLSDEFLTYQWPVRCLPGIYHCSSAAGAAVNSV